MAYSVEQLFKEKVPSVAIQEMQLALYLRVVSNPYLFGTTKTLQAFTCAHIWKHVWLAWTTSIYSLCRQEHFKKLASPLKNINTYKSREAQEQRCCELVIKCACTV